MTGSQLAAGRSYQGVDASPCMEGSKNGASRADEAAVAFFAMSAPLLPGSLFFGPSATAVRSLSRTESEK